MRRFTLSYTSKHGTRITCHNLGATGAATIERAQTDLGSRDFRCVEQTHSYSQAELDVIRLKSGTRIVS
jgi:hypothetical protein